MKRLIILGSILFASTSSFAGELSWLSEEDILKQNNGVYGVTYYNSNEDCLAKSGTAGECFNVKNKNPRFWKVVKTGNVKSLQLDPVLKQAYDEEVERAQQRRDREKQAAIEVRNAESVIDNSSLDPEIKALLKQFILAVQLKD